MGYLDHTVDDWLAIFMDTEDLEITYATSSRFTILASPDNPHQRDFASLLFRELRAPLTSRFPVLPFEKRRSTVPDSVRQRY